MRQNVHVIVNAADAIQIAFQRLIDSPHVSVKIVACPPFCAKLSVGADTATPPMVDTSIGDTNGSSGFSFGTNVSSMPTLTACEKR